MRRLRASVGSADRPLGSPLTWRVTGPSEAGITDSETPFDQALPDGFGQDGTLRTVTW